MLRTSPAGTLWNLTRDRLLFARCYRATGVWERAWGLLAGPPLAQDEALWIIPCASIHTWGMRYALDVLFLDRDDRVLHIARGARPWRIVKAPRGTRSVIELRAGDRLAVSCGEILGLRPSPSVR